VRTGDITITAGGAGNLLPAAEVSLGFRTGGVLAEVAVKAGDSVEAGQVLARLDDADARAQVDQAETAVQLAELKLAGLTDGADPVAVAAAEAALGGAEADLAKLREPVTPAALTAARENLRSAQAALAALSNPDADKLAAAKAAVTLAEINVRAAQAAYDKVAPVTEQRDGTTIGIGETKQAADLWQATTNLERATADHNALLAGPSADVLAAARARVATAQSQLDALETGASAEALAAAEAKVSQAKAQLGAVTAGADANDLDSARLGVRQAQLSLENAQRQLANTELTAPIAGTILTVQAQPGESAGAGPIVTLADLSNQSLRFWVEEADLLSVAVGNPVSVVFDALPDLTFPGRITAVDPALVTVEGALAVQAWASLELDAHPVKLLSGMTAEVEILAGEAKGALLVPAQALRELAPGSYAVFVVKDNGQLEMRPVTVGLRDFANAEILSGLAKGDVVSTGTVETE
jgi:HlyD family secretion protein